MFEDERGGRGSPRVSGLRSLRVRTAGLATAGTAALLLASMALAAPASAASINPTKGCYVNTSRVAAMTIVGTGFTPGDSIDISGTDVSVTTTATPTGAIKVTTGAPPLTTSAAFQSTKLTATDEGAPTPLTATTLVRSTNLTVTTNHPHGVKNLHKDKVKFMFSGFTPGKDIYGFYIHKKVVAKSTFGKATGPCGLLTKRALLYPGGHPRFEQYDVTFESLSKYSKKANPRVTGKLKIFKL